MRRPTTYGALNLCKAPTSRVSVSYIIYNICDIILNINRPGWNASFMNACFINHPNSNALDTTINWVFPFIWNVHRN